MSDSREVIQSARVLIIGLVTVIIILGGALILMAIARSGSPAVEERVNALENSQDECIVCHTQTTPGIVEQYGHSSMARAEVICNDCHTVTAEYPEAVEHEGAYILASPTTAMCEKCHNAEVAQFYQSRHSRPAYVAVAGSQELTAEHDVCALVRLNYEGRLRFVDGEGEIVPGIRVHAVGGHTAGMQITTVATARGQAVVASDASHYYRNLEARIPFNTLHDLPGTYRAFDRIRELAGAADLIVPGHDPLVLERLRPVAHDIVEL